LLFISFKFNRDEYSLLFIYVSQKAKLLIEHFPLTSFFIFRLIVKKIYLAIDQNGNRPVFGENQKFQKDKNFKDYILFYEYFHGDNGKGLGAWSFASNRMDRLNCKIATSKR